MIWIYLDTITYYKAKPVSDSEILRFMILYTICPEFSTKKEVLHEKI